MATPIELGLLLAVAVAVIAAYLVLRALKPFIINAVLGLLVLLVAGVLGFEVAITPIVVLVVAIGGIPGAILVLLLAYFGILFGPAAAGLAFL
ncbi:pro-sigmaK processing inhibitor BofA family protein [Halodesulfurarchaeum sp. HSR-GB]|uniref:pro-sigmaK processing inhibitor BofA family protein n=1 Tax=Halodesulfurarchaeum sp. HSR-GB TaxID=3074077 RepID=UPI00285A8ABF|nr:pro-sigmaK processing inhibitor BofA family protein [Halodesulfurarchaeum sp. HSR-GB]MDR5656048.1 pro-sigmaK processing inhibitor BofA family protein [Halodesulfurarchaeum sp. HSR-GB]